MVSIVRHDNRAMLHCMIHNVDIFILLNSVECMRLSHFLQELEVVWPLALSSYSKPYCDLRSWSFYEWWTEKKSHTVKILRVQISADRASFLPKVLTREANAFASVRLMAAVGKRDIADIQNHRELQSFNRIQRLPTKECRCRSPNSPNYQNRWGTASSKPSKTPLVCCRSLRFIPPTTPPTLLLLSAISREC